VGPTTRRAGATVQPPPDGNGHQSAARQPGRAALVRSVCKLLRRRVRTLRQCNRGVWDNAGRLRRDFLGSCRVASDKAAAGDDRRS